MSDAQCVTGLPTQGHPFFPVHHGKAEQRFLHPALRHLPGGDGASRPLSVIKGAVGDGKDGLLILHHAQQKRRVGAIGGITAAVIPIVKDIRQAVQGTLAALTLGI